jgi:hypothetical protein
MAIRKIPKLEEMEKRARVLYFAEELPKLGFQVSLDSKGSLRAVCRGCRRTYQDRFAFALDHAQECAALLDMALNSAGDPVPVPPGEVVASFSLPKPGKAERRPVKWAGPDGKEEEVVLEFKVLRRQGQAA